MDRAGNVYITGQTLGNLGGTNAGDYDAFVAKYDTSSNQLWTQLMGSSTAEQTNR